MAAGAELGINAGAPYGTQTGTAYRYFINGNSGTTTARYLTEVPKFAPIYCGLFPRLRMINGLNSDFGFIYPNLQTQAYQIWALGVKAYNPSTYILYGVTNNNNPGFNPANYSAFSTYLQAEAAWAQANGMDALCIGNENLISNSHNTLAMTISTLTRTSNVATAVFDSAHGLTNGDKVYVSGATPSNFNVADSETTDAGVAVTVIDSLTATYPSTGSDGTATGTKKMNWTAYEVVRKTKALGAICQGIFTRGPIEYSESQGHETPWINIGITPGTDIDLFGINGYGSGSTDAARYAYWKSMIDNLWAAFGTNFIITEHNVVQDSGNQTVGGLNHTQFGFEVPADTELILRYEYAKALGITQIYLFGTGEYTIFCNANPAAGVGGSQYENAYWIGDFKPLVDKIRGVPISRVFWGTNGQTGNGGE